MKERWSKYRRAVEPRRLNEKSNTLSALRLPERSLMKTSASSLLRDTGLITIKVGLLALEEVGGSSVKLFRNCGRTNLM
jgi:hypothetical protein